MEETNKLKQQFVEKSKYKYTAKGYTIDREYNKIDQL